MLCVTSVCRSKLAQEMNKIVFFFLLLVLEVGCMFESIKFTTTFKCVLQNSSNEVATNERATNTQTVNIN